MPLVPALLGACANVLPAAGESGEAIGRTVTASEEHGGRVAAGGQRGGPCFCFGCVEVVRRRLGGLVDMVGNVQRWSGTRGRGPQCGGLTRNIMYCQHVLSLRSHLRGTAWFWVSARTEEGWGREKRGMVETRG